MNLKVFSKRTAIIAKGNCVHSKSKFYSSCCNFFITFLIKDCRLQNHFKLSMSNKIVDNICSDAVN